MTSPILHAEPLGPLWPTLDPFLFCAHHDDAYPAGNGAMAPAVALEGRAIGSDFSRKDGWSMYHGDTVPGFPGHPHRGFETVTLVRRGLIDHSDSLGAAARFGGGDVQWVTAGKGIQHSEMFPLLNDAAPNPLELFQVWLNLPARQKLVEPHFTMLWNERIPRLVHHDAQGRATTVTVVAGALPGAPPPLAPPPESWAAHPGSDVAIWTLHLAPGAQWPLPAAQGQGTRRMLYFFAGEGLRIGSEAVHAHAALELAAGQDLPLVNTGGTPVECLLLQGRPIGEPVVQYGPFVMNTQQEIAQALQDYRRTQFGGWPWPQADPVHGSAPRRFARYPGQTEDEVPGA
ncbi:pirin [Acidovorax sp. SRB_14]|uniref:pirin family protein n=1 Tax=unclassified Acidovorax TaxID=2684926 RepID=UPI00145DB734|nr:MULTISPECIES: pirin-like C-terminal cupin domain-containing protein [unclassified Acidovorax]NMM78715.1 pirin [Acidovorax sp. SRB_24]NMM81144.1 pirin [Acidovorax sp. SRB_14]NMM90308.1 pirin [Rhodococcus sp. SRB_17]